MSTVTLKIGPADRILSGEAAGRAARSELRLDEADQGGDTVVVQIDTPAVTSTFIRGLIEQSVRRLGLDGFNAKYKFAAEPGVRESIRLNASILPDLPRAPDERG